MFYSAVILVLKIGELREQPLTENFRLPEFPYT